MDVRIKEDNIKFKFRVSGIIINDNKVLVDKYGDDTFSLPGGYVSLWETSLDAIKRELKEETGMIFDRYEYIGTIENFFINIRNDNTHEINMYYKVICNSSNDIDLELVENDNGYIINHHYKWISINELNNYNLLPNNIKNIIINNENNFHYIIKE